MQCQGTCGTCVTRAIHASDAAIRTLTDSCSPERWALLPARRTGAQRGGGVSFGRWNNRLSRMRTAQLSSIGAPGPGGGGRTL